MAATSSNSAIITLIIIGLVFLVINYVMQTSNAKSAIEICNARIKQELLKPEIIEQFHLSNEEYVEVFWNVETYKTECSKEIVPTVHGWLNVRPDSLLKKLSNQNFFGAKFYAKLISEDEIEIIVKYNGGALMGEPSKIRDFSYFREHFKTEP